MKKETLVNKNLLLTSNMNRREFLKTSMIYGGVGLLGVGCGKENSPKTSNTNNNPQPNNNFIINPGIEREIIGYNYFLEDKLKFTKSVITEDFFREVFRKGAFFEESNWEGNEFDTNLPLPGKLRTLPENLNIHIENSNPNFDSEKNIKNIIEEISPYMNRNITFNKNKPSNMQIIYRSDKYLKNKKVSAYFHINNSFSNYQINLPKETKDIKKHNFFSDMN